MPSLSHANANSARARIRQAALQLFLEHGYHATSMRQIARRAGISLSAIYNHFASKEELFVDLLSDSVPHWGLVAAMARATGPTVEALVRDAARRMAEALGESAANLRLVFVELMEFGGRHAPLLAGGLIPEVLGFVERLQQAEGRLKAYPPMLVARAFFGLLMSYAVSLTFFQHVPRLDLRPDDLVAFGDIFLHGVLEEEAPAAGQPAQGERR